MYQFIIGYTMCVYYLTIFHNWNLSQKVWYAVIFFMKKIKIKFSNVFWVIEILKFSWNFSTLIGSEKEFQSLFEMIQIKDRNYLHLALIFTKVQKYGVMENLKKIFKVLFFLIVLYLVKFIICKWNWDVQYYKYFTEIWYTFQKSTPLNWSNFFFTEDLIFFVISRNFHFFKLIFQKQLEPHASPPPARSTT